MEPQNIQTNSNEKILKIVVAALTVVIILLVAVGSYFLGRNSGERIVNTIPEVKQPEIVSGQVVPEIQNSETINNDQVQPPDYVKGWAESKKGYGDATWFKPVKIPSLNFFKGFALESYGLDAEPSYMQYEEYALYFVVGTTTYKGIETDIIFVNETVNNDYAFFVKDKDKYVLITKNSELNVSQFPSSSPEYAPNLVKPYSVDNTFVFNSLLSFPKKIYGNSRQSLTLYEVDPFTRAQIDQDKPVMDVPGVGKVFTKGPRNGLVVSIGPLIAEYSEKIDFVDAQGVPSVVWNDGSKNSEAYVYVGQGGCGQSNLLQIAPDTIKVTDLAPAGKNSKGDNIYLPQGNVELDYLKQLYESSYYEPSGEKKSFDEFLAMKPLFYWVDPFGQLVEFRNNKFAPLGECGKPVIYLYPEKTTNVTVAVEPKGGFSFTEPEYNGLWQVKAEPNGNLTNLSDGKNYPYLFWEGRGGIYTPPTKGFVVSQSGVSNFLSDKLSAFGFNGKEIADFKEFWLPKMQGSPYYFIGFVGKHGMDEIAPLTISPKPDTIIRVLMDFKPLQKPIDVEGYTIRTPERKGFTVVEWGGVLR